MIFKIDLNSDSITINIHKPHKVYTTDLETIINWIAHPFELSELILKPEYL